MNRLDLGIIWQDPPFTNGTETNFFTIGHSSSSRSPATGLSGGRTNISNLNELTRMQPPQALMIDTSKAYVMSNIANGEKTILYPALGGCGFDFIFMVMARL